MRLTKQQVTEILKLNPDSRFCFIIPQYDFEFPFWIQLR